MMVGVGAVLSLAAGATHGDLPEGSGEVALRFVASHKAYALVHLVSIFGGFLSALGLQGLHELLGDPRAHSVARWASASALIGAGVLAVQFSLDGFGLTVLADRFVDADSATQAMLGDVSELAADLMIGLALMWVILLYGITLCLVATTELLEPTGGRAVGVVGLILGVWIAGAAVSVALGGTLVPDWLAFVSAVVGGNLWLVAWAVSVRRRLVGRRGRSAHHAPRAT